MTSRSFPKTGLNVTGDERARIVALHEGVAAGTLGVTALLEMLTDPSWTVRREVVAALASLGDAVTPLATSLREHRDNEARIAATVDALVASVGPAEDAVAPLAGDDNPAVVADVAQILGRRRSSRSVPTLIRLLEHTDDNVAVAAIEALGRVGGRAAVDALIGAVEMRLFFRTFPAIDVLGRSGDPRAVDPLVSLLEDPQYALEAARALGRTGERRAAAPLARLLSSGVDSIARVSATALAELGERHQERYGIAAPIGAVLSEIASPAALVRKLGQCLVGADPNEQLAVCGLLGALGNEAAVPLLTRMLDTPAVAKAAAEALKKLGKRESDNEIQRALRAGDSAKRQILLSVVNDSHASDEVVLCLSDPDANVRALACDTLARLGAARAVAAVFPLLEDDNPRVVQAAIAAIQSLGSPQVMPMAMTRARSSSPSVRRAALRILSYFGYAEALDVFIEALQDDDARVRDTALQGLPFLDHPKALDTLLTAARDGTDRVRATAMRALGQATVDVRVTAALLKGLRDGDAWVRYYACQSLGRLSFEPAAPHIAALLEDTAGQVRVAAVEALSHLGTSAAFEPLVAAAMTDEPDIRRAALIGLGLSKRPEALPTLLAAATAGDPATRLVALSALADQSSPQVLPTLARAATDSDESVRTAALGFLANWSGAEATKLLVDFLEDEEARPRVLRALESPAKERVTGIVAALENADDELAPLLTSVLARLNRSDATAALFEALQFPNVAARKAAASALAALSSKPAFAALRTAADSDPDPEVRRICALLLAQ